MEERGEKPKLMHAGEWLMALKIVTVTADTHQRSTFAGHNGGVGQMPSDDLYRKPHVPLNHPHLSPKKAPSQYRLAHI